MPAPLDDEEVENIIETWKDLDDPSYNKVSDETGHSKDAVKKYVNQWREEEGGVDDDFEEPAGTSDSDDGKGTLFTPQNMEMADDFTEFMKLLNERMGFGMKEKAINMMAAEIEDFGQLPTQSDVVSFLESTDSGIKNANELTWIGQRYANWKQQYEQKRMLEGDHMGGMMGGSGGGMMGGGGSQMQGPGMNPQQSPQQQPGMGMGGMSPMLMMFQQMQQQMEEMREELRRARSGDDEDMLKEKTEEFLESRLNQLIEADSEQEQQDVIRELRALRQDLSQEGGAPSMDLGDDIQTGLIQAASRGEIEMSEAKDLLKELGEVETDPRVLEKKYEMEMKEQELEHKSERTERIGELFETATERFAQNLGEAIVQGGGPGAEAEVEDASSEAAATDGGDSAATSPAQPPQPPQQPQAQPKEQHDCKHCGTPLMQIGNQLVCQECEFGIGPCDLCGYPVEIPPQGEANFARCGDCENVLEVPDAEATRAECGECDWEGPPSDLRGEVLECDGCGEYRPILRQGDQQAQQARMQELLEADPEEVVASADDEMDDDLIEGETAGE